MADSTGNIVLPDDGAQDLSQDFWGLRSLGISLISRSGSENWTDYNLADPGITILETLVYAITDLGYRASFPIADVLAQSQKTQQELQQTQFHTAAEILPTAPVTDADLRKILLDLEGVQNAWIVPGDPFQPFTGLRSIRVQPENAYLTPEDAHDLKHRIREAFWSHRNLGDTLDSIGIMQAVKLDWCVELVVAEDSNPESVTAAVLARMNERITGRVQFLSLAAMEAACEGDTAQVFGGPVLRHGFLPDAALQPQPVQVDPGALIRSLRDVPGLESVVSLRILSPQPLLPTPGTPASARGVLPLGAMQYAILGDITRFQYQITHGKRPCKLNMLELQHKYQHQLSLLPPARQAAARYDLPIPQGQYRELDQYFTLQYDLPAIYNLRPGGLPPASDVRRNAAANQLRGYLALFDQVLANYLSQLAHISDLFSWDSQVSATYFFQGLETAMQDFVRLLNGSPDIAPEVAGPAQKQQMLDSLAQYQAQTAAFRESRTTFLSRRTRFLNHLLARLGRSLETYVSSLPAGDPETQPRRYIQAAESLLAQYPDISSRRGAGGDPRQAAARTGRHHLPGIQRVLESVFALPAITPAIREDYQRFTVFQDAEMEMQRLAGEAVLRAAGGGPLNLALAIRLGMDPANYNIVRYPPDPQFFQVVLFGEVETGSLEDQFVFLNLWRDTDSARAAIARIARRFREFSQASERVYVMEHALLAPAPSNPVFGVDLLGEDGKPVLQIAGWYPLSCVRELGKLNADNSVVVYNDQPAGQGFTFRIRSPQQGTPVHPQQGGDLPASIPPEAPVTQARYTTHLMHTWIQQHYSAVKADAHAIGMRLEADFHAPALPADWHTSGKASTLLQWGKYALWGIAHAAEFVAAHSSPAGAILGALAQGATGMGGDKQLLLGFARQFLASKLQNAPVLEKALQDNLGPGGSGADLTADAQRYLTSVGRKLGSAWLQKHFGGLSRELLGKAVSASMALHVQPDQEQQLQQLTADTILKLWQSQHPSPSGPDFLRDGAFNPPWQDYPQERTLAMQLGQQLLQIVCKGITGPSEGASASPTQTLGIFLTTHPCNVSLPGISQPVTVQDLSTLLHSRLQQYAGCAALTHGDYSGTALQSWAPDLGFLHGQSSPPPDPAFLVAAGNLALTWYMQRMVLTADPAAPNAQIKPIFDAIGYSPQAVDSSIWKMGDTQLAFLCNNLSGGNPESPESLAQAVQRLGMPQPAISSQDTVAANGAFLLSTALQQVVVPEVNSRMSAGAWLSGFMGQFGVMGSPPVSGGFQQGAQHLQAQTAQQIDALLNARSARGVNALSTLLEENALARYCMLIPPRSSVSPAGIEAQLQRITQAVPVSTLRGTDFLYDAFLSIGNYWLQVYLRNRWPWQFDLWQVDVQRGIAMYTVLGIPVPSGTRIPLQSLHSPPADTPFSSAAQPAAINLSPPVSPPAGSPPASSPPGSGTPTTPQVVLSLEYTVGDIHVCCVAPEPLETEADALAIVESLQKRIPEVISGTLAFESVFVPQLLPPIPGTVTTGELAYQASPFSNMVTVVVPAWPLRFREAGFGAQLEAALQEECPVQFLPHTLWLNKRDMQAFEAIYQNWDKAALNDLARDFYGRELAQFILSRVLIQTPVFAIPSESPIPAAQIPDEAAAT